MITKKMFSFASILAVLVLSLGLASATVSVFPPTFTGSADQGATFSVTFKIQNDNATTAFSSISHSFSNLVSGSQSISTSSQSVSNLPSTVASNTNSSDVTYSVSIPASQQIGTYSGNVTINGQFGGNTFSEIVPVNLVVSSGRNLCAKEVGDLDIEDLDIDNQGEGSDDEWESFDRIEINLDVENTNRDDDVRDVLVEIFIEDDTGDDVTSDFDIDDEEVKLGRINDRDTETATFTIEELPADLEEGKYRLYFKVYSEDEEDLQCISKSSQFSDDDYEEIEFVREDDEAVVVRERDLGAIQAVCGERDVQVKFPVYNSGDDKEDGVLVNLYNRELNIDEYQAISNLRSGKRKEVTFLIDVPENLAQDSYNLEIFTHFDYDEDEDELDENSYDQNSRDDLNKNFRKRLDIISCSQPVPSVSADLTSTASVGTDMTVRVRVTNTASEGARFTLGATGFESWADLKGIEPRSINIEAGETADAVVTLVPTEPGFNSFRLTATTNGQDYDQPISVNVAGERTDTGSGNSALRDLFENKILTYVIIGIGILLILIILVLIGRLSSRRRAE